MRDKRIGIFTSTDRRFPSVSHIANNQSHRSSQESLADSYHERLTPQNKKRSLARKRQNRERDATAQNS